MSQALSFGAVAQTKADLSRSRSGLLMRFGNAVLREWRIRRDLADLQELGSRELHDIGIGAGEIEYAVRNGRDRGTRVVAGHSARPVAFAMPASFTEWR